MEDKQLGVVEDTLYVPMLGRIYASENCPGILMDKKALELKDKLPASVIQNDKQTQYTYLASASRSVNMDRFIKDFINQNPDGVIALIGAGLETTFYRNDNGHTVWYEIDLPNVISYRKTLLGDSPRDICIPGDAFSKDWIEDIRSRHPDAPVLVAASGLFYYFEETKVIELMQMLQPYGDIEILFDTVNKSGMTMMKKKHMKTVGHEDAKMFFYVDKASDLISKIGGNAKVLAEEKYYRFISRSGLTFSTKMSMNISDLFGMVKMIHIKLDQESQ
ncbi:MAG: class I SAM-dependent methyltransferase [Saccharofermentans sp.]|nr:class I SAM-dependent methyltransferase [Saccharofermentans sp.]